MCDAVSQEATLKLSVVPDPMLARSRACADHGSATSALQGDVSRVSEIDLREADERRV